MAFTGLLSRQRVVAFATEGTAGTAETLTSADANFNISAAAWRPIVNSTASDNLSDTFTKSPPRNAGVAQGEITFTTELTGLKSLDGTAFTAAFNQSTEAFPIVKMLACCGMKQTPDAHYGLASGSAMATGTMLLDSESVTVPAAQAMKKTGHHIQGMPRVWCDDGDDAVTNDYTEFNSADTITGGEGTVLLGTDLSNSRVGVRSWTEPDDILTATISVYHGGKRFTIKGARGTFTMEATFGGTIKFNFRFLGVIVTAATGDATLLTKTLDLYPAPTYTNVDLIAVPQGTATATVLTHANISFDYGNDLTLREDASSEDGYGCASIAGRNPTLRISPDATLVASGIDWTTALTAGTPYDLFLEVNKGVIPVQEGNNFDMLFSGAVLNEESPGDRDGVETEDLTLSLTGGSLPDGSQGADSEFMILNF